MKISKSLIATAVIAVLPLAAFAGDKDKTLAPMGTATSAQFDTLDTNRDGRISPAEAAIDSKIVFSTADKNGDGYLDNSEYTHRDMSNEPSMPDETTAAQVVRQWPRIARAALGLRGPSIGSHACGNALKFASRRATMHPMTAMLS